VGLRYVIEERPGVAAVRNRALDETGGRDLLVFIDDDEEPEPGWLAALVGLWASTGCQAVAGPVIPAYEVEPEAWVRQGEFFVRRTWPTGTVRPVAASNCLLLDLGFVRRAGLRFDEAFGATGGEDTLFTPPARARAAEVLELLTVYAAMSSGFHPREVLTPVWAGRLYGALAYKHRVVTADLPAHADEQVRFLQARFGPLAGVGARVRTYVDVHHPDMGSALKPAYRYLTGGASGLARAATSAGRRLRDVGRHRGKDKGE